MVISIVIHIRYNGETLDHCHDCVWVSENQQSNDKLLVCFSEKNIMDESLDHKLSNDMKIIIIRWILVNVCTIQN